MSLTEAAHLLYAEYREGRFPMAETARDPFLIVTPRERALIPIRDLHISRSLLKIVKRGDFDIRIDTVFSDVIDQCAEPYPGRPETWINSDIKLLFNELHKQGYAHSVECWQEGRLAGGLYGLAVGGVFCGESMFSRVPNASKVALVHLCARLFMSKFSLLDAQFHNPHLEQFGLYLINQEDYVTQLRNLRDEVHDFNLREISVSGPDLIVAYLKDRDSHN
jgi:leucyl/phenylalanyl-tRNA--protein transferase